MDLSTHQGHSNPLDRGGSTDGTELPLRGARALSSGTSWAWPASDMPALADGPENAHGRVYGETARASGPSVGARVERR